MYSLVTNSNFKLKPVLKCSFRRAHRLRHWVLPFGTFRFEFSCMGQVSRSHWSATAATNCLSSVSKHLLCDTIRATAAKCDLLSPGVSPPVSIVSKFDAGAAEWIRLERRASFYEEKYRYDFGYRVLWCARNRRMKGSSSRSMAARHFTLAPWELKTEGSKG